MNPYDPPDQPTCGGSAYKVWDDAELIERSRSGDDRARVELERRGLHQHQVPTPGCITNSS